MTRGLLPVAKWSWLQWYAVAACHLHGACGCSDQGRGSAHWSMQAVVLVGALAEGALLTLLQLPAAASPLWLPLLAGAWALLFPVALLLQVTAG